MKENGICGRKVTDCTEEPVVNELELLAGVRIWRTLYTELRKLWFYFSSSSRAVELTTDLLPGINWGVWYCSPESQRLCVYSELNMHSLWVFQYNPTFPHHTPSLPKSHNFQVLWNEFVQVFWSLRTTAGGEKQPWEYFR